jgi:hypothetical protein
VGGAIGQTSLAQLDGLADLGAAFAAALGQPADALWSMRNGYAMCSRSGLDAITAYLGSLKPQDIDTLAGRLRIGVHRDVEVTDADGPDRPFVSQAFCSALPVAYSRVPAAHWQAFASLVLNAAYEATLWAAVLNAQRGASNVVLLTRLGGGAFGNDDEWIHAAMLRALNLARECNIEARRVSYGTPSSAVLAMEKRFR